MKRIREKIKKIPCAVCGSRHKQLLTLSFEDEIIGHATACCDCGHIERYVLRNKKEISSPRDHFHLTSMIRNDYTISNVECGSFRALCKDRNCKYWVDYKKDPHYHFGKDPNNYGCNPPKHNHYGHCDKHKKPCKDHNKGNSVYKPSYGKDGNKKVKKYV